jgi:predicted transcriptional regulator
MIPTEGMHVVAVIKIVSVEQLGLTWEVDGVNEQERPAKRTRADIARRNGEIIRMSKEGMKQKDIAAALGISPQTVSAVLVRAEQEGLPNLIVTTPRTPFMTAERKAELAAEKRAKREAERAKYLAHIAEHGEIPFTPPVPIGRAKKIDPPPATEPTTETALCPCGCGKELTDQMVADLIFWLDHALPAIRENH